MTAIELIDSHAHIAEAEFDADRAEVLARARAAGVQEIVVVGSGGDPSAAERAIAMAEADPDLHAVCAIHPHDAAKIQPAWWPELTAIARHPEVVAVGESGLDYYYDTSPRRLQRQVFAEFVALAIAVDKPLVCHIRDAHDDAVAILQDHLRQLPPARILIHCFTGSPEEAARYVEMGCYLSFSGIVTFKGKKSDPLRQALALVPRDRLLIETDCPYLAPTPVRGKRNEPAFVAHTAAAVAAQLGLPLAELAATTCANTRTFFSLTSR